MMVLILAGAATVWWWGPAALRPLRFFAVRRVEVEGTKYLAPEVVVGAMGLGQASSVFEDLDRLADRIRGMGGIAEVEVRRRLPGTLRVRLREVEPVALVNGPAGLVPVGADGQPLPYDVTASPVDAPVVERPQPELLGALATIQATDLGFYGEVDAAEVRGGEVVLEMIDGRVRLDVPVDPERVRAVAAVRRDLEERGQGWRELDGRFRGWVVVRRAPVARIAGSRA